jgi:hypothetical protein
MSKKANLEAKRRLERMPYRGMDINGKPLRDYTKEEKDIIKEIKREYEKSLKNEAGQS